MFSIPTVEVSEIKGASKFVSLGRLDLSVKDTYRVGRRVVPESLFKCADIIYIPGVHVFASRAYLDAQKDINSELTIEDLLKERAGKIGLVNPCHICRLS